MSTDRKLRKRLKDWSRAGLISESQAQNIVQYEENHSNARGFLFMIAWLAAGCIVLGFIALIASNWHDIPSVVKLGLYFSTFAALGAILLFYEKLSAIAEEVLRLALMAYSMAGIGLVAQIYHLHSQPWRGISFWCLITLGLAVSSSGLWGAIFWLPPALYSWFSFLETLHLEGKWIAVIGIVTAGILGIFGSYRTQKFPNLFYFRSTALIYVLLSCLLYSASGGFNFRDQLKYEVIVSFVVMAMIWAGTIWRQSRAYTAGVRLGMVLFLLFTATQMPLKAFADINSWPSAAFTFCSIILFIGSTLSLAIAAFAQGYRSLFEALCILIFLRLLVLYAESVMSLAAKGFGLITLGMFLLGGLFAWNKLKPRLYAKLEGELNAKT